MNHQAPMHTIHLATWNLRYDSKSDSIPVSSSIAGLPGQLVEPDVYQNVDGEKPWSTRRIEVARHLLNENVVLAGFQEALKRQVDDLLELLPKGGSEWGYAGVGREDGCEAGEFSPIFFNKNRLELIHDDTFWLSETPFVVGSKYPHAGCTRICTCARFKLLGAENPAEFVVLNTHLDHASELQRKLGASLLLYRTKYEVLHSECPVFVLGDFNSSADNEHDSGAYKIMTGATEPNKVDAEFAFRYYVPAGQLPGFHMKDIRGVTGPLNICGNFSTFTGFTGPENSDYQTGRIDFIFGDSVSKWQSRLYKVPSVLADDGVLASDHRPIFATISW